MGFFTPRERRELSKPADVTEFSPPRRLRAHDLHPLDNTGSMRRMTEAPLQEIDDLIAELYMRREQLISESARVQREVLEYAKLSRSTVASTKTIAEALASWRAVPAAASEARPSIVPDDTFEDDATPQAPEDAEPAGAEAKSDDPRP
jgi:hypothetical protein